MSGNINNKMPKPQFAPLNHRKGHPTVGDTHGKRREIQSQEGGLLGKVTQGFKDLFSFGNKSPRNIHDFSNSADKYLGVQDAHPALRAQREREAGIKPGGPRVTGHVDYLTKFINSYPTSAKKIKS